MTRAVETRHAEAAHRGGRHAATGAHRRGLDVIVGVNASKPRASRPSTRVSSTTRRCVQRRSRGSSALDAARDPRARRAGARGLTQAAESGQGNLLELSIEAARVRATVGEISLALERVLLASPGRNQEHFGRLRQLLRRRSEVVGAGSSRSMTFARRRAAGRACWWSSSVRMVTIAAPS